MRKKYFYLLLSLAMWATVDHAESIQDISQIQQGEVREIITPENLDELRQAVIAAQGPISIAGARCSQGGHIWYPNGTVIDITKLNKINAFDRIEKKITVESGIRWYELQAFLIPHQLSIKVMQSYNDFSIGGSLSVNVHGRDTRYGQLIETVESIKVMLADGAIVTASRSENPDLFKAVIGGYGSCGIITEATFSLTDNYPIACKARHMTIEGYKDFFFKNIHNNPAVVLHNANLYPDDLEDILSVAWYKTSQPLTVHETMMPIKYFYAKEFVAEELLSRSNLSKKWRWVFEKTLVYDKAGVVGRTYEMSYSIASLEHGSRTNATNVLQEYFIPVDALEHFVAHLRQVIRDYEVQMLNVSIRYVPKNTETLLTYAPQDSFALVCYITLENSAQGYAAAEIWTQKLIDHALDLGGTYYCPYQLFATQEQFEKSYPQHEALRIIKAQYDPHNKFSNCFIKKYLS